MKIEVHTLPPTDGEFTVAEPTKLGIETTNYRWYNSHLQNQLHLEAGHIVWEDTRYIGQLVDLFGEGSVFLVQVGE